jgi:hypothetical protein
MYRIDEHLAVWNARRQQREQDAEVHRLVRRRRLERQLRQVTGSTSEN